jgi:hypothetical protein
MPLSIKRPLSITTYLLILFLIAVVVSTKCSDDEIISLDKDIISLDKEIFYPLFSANLPNGPLGKYLGYQKGTDDYINYFTASGMALELLISPSRGDSSDIKEALKTLDKLESTFEKHNYFPRPAYKDLAYGWSSSMDAPLVCLTSLVAFEITGNQRYFNFYEKIIPYLLKSNKEHGFLLKNSDSTIFPLEYCGTSTTDSTAKYVLNGSLVSYLSLSIISRAYGNPEITALLTKIDGAYGKRLNAFLREDSLWTYYMLNPLTTNQGHYHIYEMKLFSAIHKISGKKMYRTQYEIREKMLREIYDLKIVNNANSYGYYFLRAAAPHPYVIELYGTSLRFYDSKDNLIHEDSRQRSGYMSPEEYSKNAYMTGNISKECTKYELISFKGNIETILFEEQLTDLVSKNSRATIFTNYKLTASGDATVENNNQLVVSKDLSEKVWAEVYISFNSPIRADPLKYYYLELSGGIEGVNMKLTLYDSEGNALDRYLPLMTKGNNLVLFSLLGFNYDTIDNVNKMRLKIYTESKGFQNENSINIEDVGVLDNEFEVIEYLRGSEFIMNSEL